MSLNSDYIILAKLAYPQYNLTLNMKQDQGVPYSLSLEYENQTYIDQAKWVYPHGYYTNMIGDNSKVLNYTMQNFDNTDACYCKSIIGLAYLIINYS